MKWKVKIFEVLATLSIILSSIIAKPWKVQNRFSTENFWKTLHILYCYYGWVLDHRFGTEKCKKKGGGGGCRKYCHFLNHHPGVKVSEESLKCASYLQNWSLKGSWLIWKNLSAQRQTLPCSRSKVSWAVTQKQAQRKPVVFNRVMDNTLVTGCTLVLCKGHI